MRRLLPAAAFALLLAAAPARAGLVAASVGPVNGLIGQEGTIGWGFTPTADITVTALGVFDWEDNGLRTTHPIAIWEAGGAMVVSATVQAGIGSALTDGFRYEAVAATTLQAGHDYVIGALYRADPSGEKDEMVQDGITTVTTDGHITLDSTTQGRFSSFLVLFRPDDVSPLPPAFGANFQFDQGAATTAVPAPPAAALLGIGVLSLCGYGWRRRKAAVA